MDIIYLIKLGEIYPQVENTGKAKLRELPEFSHILWVYAQNAPLLVRLGDNVREELAREKLYRF